MRSRWLSVLTAALLLGAPACGGDDEGAEKSTEQGDVTGPQTFRVQIDGDSSEFEAAILAYLPEELTARPGDSVRFELPHFTGEPHTVTFGTLVDAAVDKLDQAGTSMTYSERENLPEVLKLTDPFPHKPGKGPPDANQAGAQPCYLDSVEPPFPLEGSGPACPKREQPEFNGRQSFYNSGILQADGDSFTVKLAADTPPGNYSYFCLVHRTLMTAELEVAEAKASVPGPEKVTEEGRKELEEAQASLRPAAQALAAAPVDKPVAGAGPSTVFEGKPAPINAFLTEFGPKEVSVPVGGSLTWDVRFFHTVSINAPEEAVGVLQKAPDGSFHINPKVFPADSPLPPVDYLTFPATAKKPVTIDGGRFTGAFKSLGFVGSLPDSLISYKVTFPKAGSYSLRCLLHPDMKGQIKVG
jgi:plastocyanin